MVRLIEGQHACEASLWVAGCFGHALSMKLSVFQRNGCINFVFYCHTLSHIYIQMTTKKGSVVSVVTLLANSSIHDKDKGNEKQRFNKQVGGGGGNPYFK